MKCVDLIFDMKYVVLFQRPNSLPNMDEWFRKKEGADKRCEELQLMFDWLYFRNGKKEEKTVCWVESVF